MILLSRLDRYVGAHILGAFAVVMLVLLGLMGISMVLDEAGDVSERYPLSAALFYVLLSLPDMAYQLLPLGALTATLVGLGMLASSSELTVMRASGLSLNRLILTVLKPVFLLAAMAMLMAEYGVPLAQQSAEGFKTERQGARAVAERQAGAWYRERDAFIHVDAIVPSGELIGVEQHRFDLQNRLLERLTARSATYDSGSWQLDRVQRVRFAEDGTAMQIEQLPSLDWDTELTPELLNVVLVEPRYLPMSDLGSYSSYLRQQGVDPKRYDLAYWNKILQPLSIIALVLVGTAFIFGPLRSVTVGQRILTGVIVGLIFKFSQDLLAPASQVLGFAAFWAALIPILVSLLFALLLLSRVR